MTQGDDLRAAREFERTVELFSRDAEFLPYALRYAGRSWARSGRPDRARAACIRLLRDHPRSKEAQALAAASPSSPLRECVIVR